MAAVRGREKGQGEVVEFCRLVDRLDMGCERKKGIKDDTEVFGLNLWSCHGEVRRSGVSIYQRLYLRQVSKAANTYSQWKCQAGSWMYRSGVWEQDPGCRYKLERFQHIDCV